MGVVMKGGSSGNRADALPQVPSSGYSQPVLDTDTSGPEAGGVQWGDFPSRPQRGGQNATPSFMPTGCSPVGGTDIEDPGATTGGDERVFRGSPNTGVKGGPA